MATANELTGEDTQNIIGIIRGKCDSVREDAQRESKCTIFRVPAHICRGREDLFRPQLLSIGPYHRGKEDLRDMEKVKWKFLLEIREGKPGSLEACVKMLKDLEERARACYFNEVHLDRHEFVEMLLLDGCFIIQLFIKWDTKHFKNTPLKSKWNRSMIMHDLLLLENQIPFFVLRDMFHLISVTNSTLGKIAMEFLDHWDFMSRPKDIPLPNININGIHHLLHLFYRYHIKRPAASRNSPRGIDPSPFMRGVIWNPIRRQASSLNQVYPQAELPPEKPVMIIPSATRPVEAGVRFRKKRSDNFLDIDFRNGTLHIPFISIEESALYRLANLLALEQLVNVGEEITSYAAFMDFLIDTPDDVEILRRKGILGKMMSSNKEVADFFNQLCFYSLLNFRRHYLLEVFKEVDDYCRSSWHENRAKLVRDYFSSPWASISVVAATLLLSLTFLQTFMSFYSYYHNPSS